MEKIASFQVNHDTITPGMYISRIDFGDTVTYDLRFCYPNSGEYLYQPAAHTIEHLFATWVRSNKKIGDSVVYFGPMGCLTGFYLILRGVSHSDAIDAVKQGMEFIRDFQGDIPGASREECGNYLMHDLTCAKITAKRYCEAIKDWNEPRLVYPK